MVYSVYREQQKTNTTSQLPNNMQTQYLGVRIPKDLKKRLKMAAAAEEKTMDSIVAGLIAQYCAERDRAYPIASE